ncbi:hypothetical protein SY88_12625 [Clostridiales bacterium PH28_bin88]|nr:hypothetical protein SY88_12625 [Clostridiales bacterium PH28_bin88]
MGRLAVKNAAGPICQNNEGFLACSDWLLAEKVMSARISLYQPITEIITPFTRQNSPFTGKPLTK